MEVEHVFPDASGGAPGQHRDILRNHPYADDAQVFASNPNHGVKEKQQD